MYSSPTHRYLSYTLCRFTTFSHYSKLWIPDPADGIHQDGTGIGGTKEIRDANGCGSLGIPAIRG